MAYDNTNRFTLFKNTLKDAGSKQPDYTGTLNADGVEFRLSAWIQEGKSGKFFSGSVQLKDGADRTEKKTEQDDEVPF